MSAEPRSPTENIEKTRNTPAQLDFYEQLNRFIGEANESALEKMMSFAIYTSRQAITTFVEKYELFKLVKGIPGSIIECGVAGGQGLFTFAHLCTIFEPYHYVRKIVGFDTFAGFEGITDKDKTSRAAHLKPGGLRFDSFEKLSRAIELFDMNRAIGHIPKVELIKGDISQTLPRYVEEHPALVVGLLYLDLDLYRPTLDTLKLLLPRIPKGGIIAFDELNHSDYPGETLAAMEVVGLNNLELKRFEVGSTMCYARLGG